MFQNLHFIAILLFISTIVFSIGYIIILYRIKGGWDDTAEWEVPENFIPTTKLSIVIAARNEEKAITKCLESILGCHYPKELYEIIVVNDHSMDSTASIVKNLKNDNVKLVNLDSGAGKKSALEKGIEKATGNLIACTDADCIVPNDWLISAVSYFEQNNPQCIAAPITYTYDSSILQRFQFLDAINNMCVTANGIKRKSYYMANGANFFFRKSAFEEVGGYAQNIKLASGDDMFLIQKIAKKYPQGVSFLKSMKAAVKTLPENSLNGFISQRTRWATKSKAYTNKNILKIQGFVFSFVFLIVSNLVLSLFGYALSLIGLLLALFIKLTADYYYLSKLSDFFQDRTPLKSFLGASIAFIIYILFAGWKALLPSKFKWKGRVTR